MKCELTGEPRRLPVREHGSEARESVPVAIEDRVHGRLLAVKLKTREHGYRDVSRGSEHFDGDLICPERRRACRDARP
jgi:hypothetical protein